MTSRDNEQVYFEFKGNVARTTFKQTRGGGLARIRMFPAEGQDPDRPMEIKMWQRVAASFANRVGKGDLVLVKGVMQGFEPVGLFFRVLHSTG